MEAQRWLLAGGDILPARRRHRAILFLLWLALVGWFLAAHVVWRDEVRAYSLALSGSSVAEMLSNVHGEGHPALWYLLLRGAHHLYPSHLVLPMLGAATGFAAMAILAFFAPFRTFVVALVLFSTYGAFEYVAVSRNYAIAALLMFLVAALYPRIKNSLWLGLLAALLCNTNVPSCIFAAGFLVFRLVEMLTDGSGPKRREWLILLGNGLLAFVGAALVFVTVYPTVNEAAVSPNYGFSAGRLLAGLVDLHTGFSHMDFGLGMILVPLACLGLAGRPATLAAGLFAFVAAKEFFYLVYPSAYRHEILELCFLIALFWLSAEGQGGTWTPPAWLKVASRAGRLSFLAVLLLESASLVGQIRSQLAGIPYSRSCDVARLLRQPPLRGAIVMADPDTMLEALPYYSSNPLYFLRQKRFGTLARLSSNDRQLLTLDDVLADADRLHRRTGRPVLFLSHLQLAPGMRLRRSTMYRDETLVTPASARRFLASTRLLGRLRPSRIDENYDVYLYPR